MNPLSDKQRMTFDDWWNKTGADAFGIDHFHACREAWRDCRDFGHPKRQGPVDLEHSGDGDAAWREWLAHAEKRDPDDEVRLLNYRDWIAVLRAALRTPSARAYPTDNDGKEQDAFEEWAKANKFDVTTHPLHWLFLDRRTYAAREGWRGALQYVAKVASDTAPEEERKDNTPPTVSPLGGYGPY